jgi:hypothetical protein
MTVSRGPSSASLSQRLISVLHLGMVSTYLFPTPMQQRYLGDIATNEESVPDTESNSNSLSGNSVYVAGTKPTCLVNHTMFFRT